MNKLKWTMTLAAFLSCKFVLAQHTFSPYTLTGIGDLNSMALANNEAMGGIGIATPSYWNINNINPALLTFNSLTVFEFGLAGENRTISNRFSKSKVASGGFKYLSFAFPIMPNTWTASFGIMPYSTVNYSFTTRQDVKGTNVDATIDFEGSGGLNQVYFSNGVKIGKNLSAGLRMSYIFGLVEARTQTLLQGEGIVQQFPTGVFEKTNYTGFNFGLGTSYRKVLSETNVLNIGLTYDFASSVDGNRLIRLEVENTNGSIVPNDTLVNNQEGSYQMPAKIGFGLSWQKPNKLSLGLDVVRTIWNRNAGFSDDNEAYRSTWMVGLGFEITPAYNDVDNYLKRIKYRVGLSFQQEPMVIDGETLNDFGINFGCSLPVKGVSAVNLSVKYGQRGSESGALVKEEYFKFVLGATINDRWFIRRKYN